MIEGGGGQEGGLGGGDTYPRWYMGEAGGSLGPVIATGDCDSRGQEGSSGDERSSSTGGA